MGLNKKRYTERIMGRGTPDSERQMPPWLRPKPAKPEPRPKPAKPGRPAPPAPE